MKIKYEHNMNVSEDTPGVKESWNVGSIKELWLPISNIRSYTIKYQKYCVSALTKNGIEICKSVQ